MKHAPAETFTQIVTRNNSDPTRMIASTSPRHLDHAAGAAIRGHIGNRDLLSTHYASIRQAGQEAEAAVINVARTAGAAADDVRRANAEINNSIFGLADSSGIGDALERSIQGEAVLDSFQDGSNPLGATLDKAQRTHKDLLDGTDDIHVAEMVIGETNQNFELAKQVRQKVHEYGAPKRNAVKAAAAGLGIVASGVAAWLGFNSQHSQPEPTPVEHSVVDKAQDVITDPRVLSIAGGLAAGLAITNAGARLAENRNGHFAQSAAKKHLRSQQ